jgi:hypothetical protein
VVADKLSLGRSVVVVVVVVGRCRHSLHRIPAANNILVVDSPADSILHIDIDWHCLGAPLAGFVGNIDFVGNFAVAAVVAAGNIAGIVLFPVDCNHIPLRADSPQQERNLGKQGPDNRLPRKKKRSE